MKSYEKNLETYLNTGKVSVLLNELNDTERAVIVKELFNIYFKDHLYGKYRSDENIILSSGSVDHDVFNMPKALKFFIKYALDRNWYGYSDSRGRIQTRAAIALYENAFFNNHPYTSENICITMGATAAISDLLENIFSKVELGNWSRRRVFFALYLTILLWLKA